METSEFDATLGGAENLPYLANSLKFAASRSVEIAAMTESILRPSKTKLIFQSLPVHMRRRVMSHNCKRLPIKLRKGHLEQLKKSGLPPKQNRPSRKYRKRPGNLLEEYNRRQKKNVWLETHIWHAKRFHMIERWGHKIAYAPCDKAFRACYRASSAHCLIQDISYYIPIQISGQIEFIRELFSCLTDCLCGLGVCAKAFSNGAREGRMHLYKPNVFPFGYIGRINFIWVSNTDSNKTLWLFVHPSMASQVEWVLSDQLCKSSSDTNHIPEKKRKLEKSFSEDVQIKVLKSFNRFRLIGPKSHAVMTSSLKCVEDAKRIKTNNWVASLKNKSALHLKEKREYWHNISMAGSPSQLSPHIIIGLIVKDPRLSRPQRRTKATRPESDTQIKTEVLLNIPKEISTSPLWDTNIHDVIKEKRLTNCQFIEHVTKTQLVPGEVNEDDTTLQSVPVVLVQRPGSQNAEFKKLGFGSGWDIILPSGYGLPFWQTCIMFGARSGGLRESESLAFETGECYLPPDSDAGKEEEKRIERELREKYFRLPPSKRVNYAKLAVNSPFVCPWKVLLNDWSSTPIEDYFVLRDRKRLESLQECITKKKTLPQIDNESNCLLAVYIQIEGKGSLKRHALLCVPHKEDLCAMKTLFEPQHEDRNEMLRKQKRKEHMKDIKKWRRKRIKMKNGSGECITKKKTLPQIDNESNCLLAVYIQIEGKGSLKRHALLCVPHKEDLCAMKTLFEPQHEDRNEMLRKQKRKEHMKDIKKWRRKRIKMKNGSGIQSKKTPKRAKQEPSEYVKSMQELWVPSNITTVRHTASRQTIGYLSQGAFSFTESKSCGIGYIAYNGLKMLLSEGFNQILVRNTTSRKYRLAKCTILKDV